VARWVEGDVAVDVVFVDGIVRVGDSLGRGRESGKFLGFSCATERWRGGSILGTEAIDRATACPGLHTQAY
jgi:hypothetical protein